ncbi:hypothetical protein EKO27_g7535 [Xylaria grammica]|uniref:SprT-like domain-containing protein n=1 Tax=Xylaria grammica TaxID=363999 RepID=A0A439CZE5_9PEZI|nr:hypothetical protein EKO27_g7535 [Xylaria grammica]
MNFKGLKKTKDKKGAKGTRNPKEPVAIFEPQHLWSALKTSPVTKAPKLLFKYAIRWICREPKVPGEAAHPEWPGYTGTGTKLNFKLNTRAYKSQELVENTVFSFFPMSSDRNLTPTQISTRTKIISLYRKAKNKKKPFRTRDINRFLCLLDQFFFFGAMVNNGRPRVYCKLWQKQSGLIKLCAPSLVKRDKMPWGYTRHRHIKNYGPFEMIHMPAKDFFDYPEKISVSFLLETLVHEMVHAYVNLFLCQCRACHKDMINTKGITGHGKTFIMILDCIDYTLRTWDVGLSGLMRQVVILGGEHHIFDEVKMLHQHEMELYRKLAIPVPEDWHDHAPPTLNPTAPTEETLDHKRTEVTEDKEIKGPRARWVEVNAARALDDNDPEMNVYMTAPQVGGTMVKLGKLNQTGDIVQALVTDAAAKSIKNKIKRKFENWPKLDRYFEIYAGLHMNIH